MAELQMAMTQNFVWVVTDDTESDFLEYKQFVDKKIIRAEEQERFDYTLFKGYHGLTLSCRTEGVYDLYRVYDKGKLVLESEDPVIELGFTPKDLVVKCFDRLGEDRLVQLAISKGEVKLNKREKSDFYKLSVVVPCYKSELFMSRTIDSILSNSIDNLQLVLVNDGSPDNALEIMKRYEREYGCVKVINQDNLRLSMARNNGLANVDGEYMAFCDSDDIIHPLMYEKLYKACIDNDTDIAIGKVLVHEQPEKRDWVLNLDHDVVYTFNEMMEKKDTKENIYFVAVNNKIVKTEVARKAEFSRDYIGKTFVYEDIAYTGSLYSYIERFSFCKDAIYIRDKRKRATVGTVSTWHKNEDNDYTWRTFIYGASYPLYHKSGKNNERHDFTHFKRLMDSYKKFQTPCPLKSYWDSELRKLIISQKLNENKLIMGNVEMNRVIKNLGL